MSGGDERALYPLIKALKDENTGVQDAAMQSLIAIGSEVTAYMVIPLLREDAFLRNTALIILKEIGRKAVPLLNILFGDKDDDVRKFAVDLVCEIGHCEHPDTIARMLIEDTNPNVRASAAKAIGFLNYKEAMPQLMAALEDEEWVCFSALEALSVIKEEAPVRAIEALLSNRSDAVRFAAIEALGMIPSPLSGEALLNHLSRAEGYEKNATVKSLVQTGITPSMSGIADILMDMFKSDDWEDKLVALKGLVGLKENKAIFSIADSAGSLDPSSPETDEKLYILEEALRSFGCADALFDALNNPSLRYRGKIMIIEALGDLQCSEAVSHLIRFLEGDIRDVRRASLKALAGMDDPDGTKQIFIDSMDDYDGHVRRMSITALGKIGERSSFEPILRHLSKEIYEDAKEEGLKALLMIDPSELFSHIGEFNAFNKKVIGRYAKDLEILLALSINEDTGVRAAALSGLGGLQDERAYKRLSEAMDDDDPEIRKAAVIAAGESRCCREAIESALKDRDTWVRVYAVKALTRFSDGAALGPLRNMLEDKETPVVLSAIEAIASIGGSEAMGALSPLLEHENYDIRENVNRALEGIC